jgi:hypothetical protein
VFETNTELSGKYNQPAPPVNVIVNNGGAPITGTVEMIRNTHYRNASPVLRIPKNTAQNIWDMTIDMLDEPLGSFKQTNLETIQLAPSLIGNGSGPVEGERALSVQPYGIVTGPYGTADNTYSFADQNPVAPGFTGEVTPVMDYRADCDPRFQYIARSSPRTFGYTTGYLDGTAEAPNGFPTGAGIAFPQNPEVGAYFLRTDYLPQILYRWDGRMWIRISKNVRTQTGFTEGDLSQQSSFINNSNVTVATDGTTFPQKQGLSTILTLSPDPIPPVI